MLAERNQSFFFLEVFSSCGDFIFSGVFFLLFFFLVKEITVLDATHHSGTALQICLARLTASYSSRLCFKHVLLCYTLGTFYLFNISSPLLFFLQNGLFFECSRHGRGSRTPFTRPSALSCMLLSKLTNTEMSRCIKKEIRRERTSELGC